VVDPSRSVADISVGIQDTYISSIEHARVGLLVVVDVNERLRVFYDEALESLYSYQPCFELAPQTLGLHSRIVTVSGHGRRLDRPRGCHQALSLFFSNRENQHEWLYVFVELLLQVLAGLTAALPHRAASKPETLERAL
jgi:hypothetical protein